jgi:hypothetical protein
MKYQQIDQYTFGKNPAAMYLVRKLNELNDPIVTKSVSRRIVSTRTHVANLVAAYQSGFLAPKTMANTLRLMRLEATDTYIVYPEFIWKLMINVQIGAIKQAMRLATVARKAETRMNNLNLTSKTYDEDFGLTGFTHWWYDHQSNKYMRAGRTVDDISMTKIFKLDEVSDITPELLHQRSQARCVRLGKEHTK